MGLIVLLISELLGKDNLLLASDILHLPLAVLNNFIDNFLLLRKFRNVRRLLVLQLILKLGKKLDVDCRKIIGKLDQGHIRGPRPDNTRFARTFSDTTQCHLPSDEGALKMLEVEKAA